MSIDSELSELRREVASLRADHENPTNVLPRLEHLERLYDAAYRVIEARKRAELSPGVGASHDVSDAEDAHDALRKELGVEK